MLTLLVVSMLYIIIYTYPIPLVFVVPVVGYGLSFFALALVRRVGIWESLYAFALSPIDIAISSQVLEIAFPRFGYANEIAMAAFLYAAAMLLLITVFRFNRLIGVVIFILIAMLMVPLSTYHQLLPIGYALNFL